MGCAQYVGRIGALAVVLGVGAVVAAAPGIAWAEPTTSSEESSAESGSDPAPTAEAKTDHSSRRESRVRLSTGSGEDHDGVPREATGRRGAAAAQESRTRTPENADEAVEEEGEVAEAQIARATTANQPAAAQKASAVVEKGQRSRPTASPPEKSVTREPLSPDTGRTLRRAADVDTEPAAATAVAPAPVLHLALKNHARDPVSTVPVEVSAPPPRTVMPGVVVSVGLRPAAGTGSVPVEASLAWAVAAVAASRRFGQAGITPSSPPADEALTSQTLATRQLSRRDTTAPSVSLTAPSGTVSGTVTLRAGASDNVGVAGVRFLVDGVALAGEDTSAPYSMSWNTTTATNGTHTLTARARDAAGNTTTSRSVTVTVANPDTTAPTVSLTAPSGTVSGTVNLSAGASDNVGVAGVRFLVDGVALAGEDTSAPYSMAWNTTTATNGTHTLTARARDAAGNTTTSTAVTVTVANTAPLPVNVTPIAVNAYPSAIAISGGNAYVYGGDVITTINTSTKAVTDITALYHEAPAITQDGRRYAPNPKLWAQGSAPYNSVDVFNNATNQIIRNIPLEICYDCAYANPWAPRDVELSPNGSRAYVSEDYSVETGIMLTVVSVIDTSTDRLLGYFPVGPMSDMEFAADGIIYAASAEYATVATYDADLNLLASIPLTSIGHSWDSPTTALALNATGTRGYVVVRELFGPRQHVSVIDTSPASPTRNTELAVITERTTALSPDGSRRYVTQPDGRTVLVYNNTTNAQIGFFVTDQATGTGPRSIAVAADGTVYVTDMDDNKVYAVTMVGQTAL